MKAIGSIASKRPIGGFVCQSCTYRLQRRNRTYATTASTPEIYDVVCVGGGPAGLSLLAALRSSAATSGLKIALVESQDLSRTRNWTLPSTQYSNRCSSLTPASVAFLDDIGAWKHIKRERVQGYEEMQVWDGVSGERIEFDWRGEKGKTIAYMTENLNLTSGLLSRLDEVGGVSVYDNTKVEDIQFGEQTEAMDLSQWPTVSLSSGKRIAARLLVGADGANSPVRTFAGIDSKGWDYNRHGVVATVQLEGETGNTAFQRFLPTGPVALLPLPNNFATLVWSTTPALATHLKTLSEVDFTALVNAAFRLSPVDLKYMHSLSSGQLDEYLWRLNHTSFSNVPSTIASVQEGSVASFPLKLRHADTYIGERVALVGDAAHTIHPLAGQGLNQGQGDVQSLSKTIEYAATHGMDIGTTMSLESYNSERYAANHILLGVVDKLHKVYATDSAPVVGLRSLGLRAVNSLGPLKGFFMNQAAGNGVKLF